MATTPNDTLANDLVSEILGSADPGNSGKADEGEADDNDSGDTDGDDLDTGPVEDQDDDQDDDNDEPDAGDDAGDDTDQDEEPAPKPRKRQREEEDTVDGDNDPFSPKAKVKTDKLGNVYIGNKLIAKAGREARLYMGWRKSAIKDREDADRLAVSTAKIAQGARELYTRYQTLQQQKTLFDNAGLTAEEQAQLLPIATAYKKSPIEGIKLLLTRAHMAGVDIKSLGAGNALDPKVLMDDMKGHFTELLKPVLSQTTQSANQEKLREETVGFFQRNPRAKDVAKLVGGSHRLGQILKEAKQRAPDVSLDDLFGQLDYALLRQFGGQLPTGPVGKKPGGKQASRNAEKKMERNLRSSVRTKPDESIDQIGRNLLKELAAAEKRGF